MRSTELPPAPVTLPPEAVPDPLRLALLPWLPLDAATETYIVDCALRLRCGPLPIPMQIRESQAYVLEAQAARQQIADTQHRERHSADTDPATTREPNTRT